MLDMVSGEDISESEEFTGWFYVVIFTPFILGLLHHVDHIVRGNHVGWPITAEVNPFTYSLLVYPMLLVGLYMTWFTDRKTTNYWIGFFGFSSILVTYTHVFIEPPADILGPRSNPVIAYLALALMIALSAALILGLGYMVRRSLS
jgi:hypothetical protein